MKFPFEVSLDNILKDPDPYIDAIFASLESDFLFMPKGKGFVPYSVFENGYEALKRETQGFHVLESETIFRLIEKRPIVLIVLRSMLGFTPPEWAYLTTRRTGISVSQGFARTLDRKVRMTPEAPLNLRPESARRVQAMVKTACQLLSEGAEKHVVSDQIYRLDKVDTAQGLTSLQHVAQMGVPYAMLLYERFLGRPFAGHRDSVSELVGARLETAIERLLQEAGVSFRKTKRAERIAGFDQAPDFIIPSEFNPHVVIEAKITEDDGTARDKVTRIQHLAALSLAQGERGEPKFEVVACIGGRGFGVRREDMKKLLIATRGKVFTMQTLEQMLTHTQIRDFVSSNPQSHS